MIAEVNKLKTAINDIKAVANIPTNTNIDEIAGLIKNKLETTIEDHTSFYTAIIFKRSDAQPDTPIGGYFYGINSDHNIFEAPDGWELSVPKQYDLEEIGKIWISTAIFISQWNSEIKKYESIIKKDWAEPVRITGINGIDGINGVNGKNGIDGRDATSIQILGKYNTLEELIAEHPIGSSGDAYVVGSDLYVWSGGEWSNMGQFTGEDGDTIIQAIAFYRSNSTIYDGEIPTGGDFEHPYPIGWSDGMPDISTGKYVYFSKATFQASTPDAPVTAWTTPTRLGDSESVDYEYCCLETTTGIPVKLNPDDDSVYIYRYNEDFTAVNPEPVENGYCDINGWFDETPEISEISEKIKWMATCKVHNNEYYKDSEELPNWIINKIKGEIGEIGEKGEKGKIAYPAGEWEAKVYEQTDTTTPYVIYDSKYYVLNVESATAEDIPGISDKWILMDAFEAIYTKLLIANNGQLGKFYFYEDYMFSEEGFLCQYMPLIINEEDYKLQQYGFSETFFDNNYPFCYKNPNNNEKYYTKELDITADTQFYLDKACTDLSSFKYYSTKESKWITKIPINYKDLLTRSDIIIISNENQIDEEQLGKKYFKPNFIVNSKTGSTSLETGLLGSFNLTYDQISVGDQPYSILETTAIEENYSHTLKLSPIQTVISSHNQSPNSDESFSLRVTSLFNPDAFDEDAQISIFNSSEQSCVHIDSTKSEFAVEIVGPVFAHGKIYNYDVSNTNAYAEWNGTLILKQTVANIPYIYLDTNRLETGAQIKIFNLHNISTPFITFRFGFVIADWWKLDPNTGWSLITEDQPQIYPDQYNIGNGIEIIVAQWDDDNHIILIKPI